MIKFDIKFDGDGMRRQMIEAAEKQVREKLRSRGIYNVTVKATGMVGDEVKFQFSGPDDDVKKAKAIFGS